MKKCPKCGTDNEDNAILCCSCSTDLNKKSSPTWNDILNSKNGEYDDLFDGSYTSFIPDQNEKASLKQSSASLKDDEMQEENIPVLEDFDYYEPLIQGDDIPVLEEFDDAEGLTQEEDSPTQNYNDWIDDLQVDSNTATEYFQVKKIKSGNFGKLIFFVLFLFIGFYLINAMTATNDTYNEYQQDYEQTKSAIESDSENAMTHMPGRYYVNFIMAIRNGPSSSNAQTGRAEQGSYVQIVETTRNTDGSYWGKTSDGGYICISDNQTTYLTES